MSDIYDDYDPDDEEWQPDRGECDQCLMRPGEVNDTGPFAICCACSIGQGASLEDCRCGPQEGSPEAKA